MVLVVIFQVEVSAVHRRFLPCLRDGVVRQNVGKFHGVWRLWWSVGGIGAEVRYIGGHREVTRPVGGWVNFFSEDSVGGVQNRGPHGIGIRGFVLVSPGQSICKSLIRGRGAYRGGKASP